MDYLREFISSLEEEGRSKHTIKAYASDIKQFQTWLEETYGEEKFTPSSITKLDITSYRSYLLTVAQRKPSGINRALSSLSAFCSWAQKQGYISGNPVDGVPQAKQVKAPPKALEDKDLNRLLRTVYKAGKKRDIAIVELMVGAGLRIGEVEALDLQDIKINERKGFVEIRQGKGSKYRTVPLNKDVRKAILDYLEEERPQDDSPSLFISQKGGRLTSNAIWKVIKKYAKEAGLPDITPHSLRHTFGTNLIRKHGVDIVTTATLMGHSNISTTAIYTRPNEQDMIEAVEKLSKS